MDLSTRRLRYFLAVAEYEHFGRAADALFVSRSALSEQIRRLEQELGVRLFDRNPRGAQLTTIGKDVVRQARIVLDDVAHLSLIIDRFERERSGKLRLGFVTMAAGKLTPQIVAAVEAIHPLNTVELVHLDYARQVQAVLTGEVDASIVRGPIDTTHLRTVILLNEPRMAMFSQRHRLAGRASVSCADLRGEVRVDTEGVSPEWRRWWSLDPGADGQSPPYGPMVHSFEEQLEMAAGNVAMSIVPATAADVYRRADVAFVPISDAEPSEILLCASKEGESPLVDVLFEVCALL